MLLLPDKLQRRMLRRIGVRWRWLLRIDDKQLAFHLTCAQRQHSEHEDERHILARAIARTAYQSRWLFILLVALTVGAHAQRQLDGIQVLQDGTVTPIHSWFGGVAKLKCSTNVTCTYVGNTVTIASSGGSAVAGGANTQVQYNGAGALAGDSTFTFNATSKRFTVTDLVGSQPFRDVRWPGYGALCDNSTDDSTAIQAAIDALPTHGGTVLFPEGDCKFGTTLNVAGKSGVRLLGMGGEAIGQSLPPASQIIYTGTGARGIDARSSEGFTIEHLGVRYNSASFTGTLIDFNHNGLGGADAAYSVMRDCLIGGTVSTAINATYLISYKNSIIQTVDHCHLNLAQIAITGTEGGTGYANAIQIVNSTFDNTSIAAIADADQGWHITGNTFDAVSAVVGSGLVAAYKDTTTAAPVYAFDFSGNWVGDCSGTTSHWLQLSSHNGDHIAGNYFGDCTPSFAIQYRGTSTCSGGSITGNFFGESTNIIDLGSSTNCSGLSIIGNQFFYAVTNPPVQNYSSSKTNICIMANQSPGVPSLQPTFCSASALQLTSGSPPGCNAANRGQFWYVGGAAGVKDIVEVCAKDAADSYAYRSIY